MTDLDAARRGLIRLGRDPSPITTLPGVVRFLDVEDPWGNRLGYYQDIVDAGEATGPGGSVHDEAWFEVDEP